MRVTILNIFKLLFLTQATLVFPFRELIETMAQNTLLRKQVSDLTVQKQQQVSPKNSLHVFKIKFNM